jgi:putative transposase
MPKPLRTIVPGLVYHVMQRGNNKEDVFQEEQDYRKYLELTCVYAGKNGCRISGYCLMPNHIHLLVRAGYYKRSISKMIQGINVCYARYLFEKYGHRGHVWESRFLSYPVEEDSEHLWTVALYIDQNPCRAGLCELPQQYLYSSARAHTEGRQDEVLSEVLFEDEAIREYAEEMAVPCSEKSIEEIARHARLCHPMGSETFITKIEKKVGRALRPGRRGRPKKQG